MKPLAQELCAPIDTLGDAQLFIRALGREGLMWHFEDCPIDCLHDARLTYDGEALISREDAELLGQQRDKLYSFDWGAYECPIGFALHVHDPENYPALD